MIPPPLVPPVPIDPPPPPPVAPVPMVGDPVGASVGISPGGDSAGVPVDTFIPPAPPPVYHDEWSQWLEDQAAPDKKKAESAIRILPDFSRYASSQWFAGEEDSEDDVAYKIPQPGDKALIYALKSRKELNKSYCTLLQFDRKAQRWEVDLMDLGIRTGRQLAIKPSNLRWISPAV
jgi:hypothetical protein